MKQFIYLFSIIIWTTISSCGQNEYKSATMAYDESVTLEESLPAPASDDTEITESNVEFQRKIIKEGTIRFETTNSEETRQAILKSVKENKGYLANDNAMNYGGNTNYEIMIRVPADKFDTLLEQIANAAKKIDSKEIKTLDVTEEFIDIEARIKTKKELENRYKEILKQAHKVEDILQIEKEIGALRTEIESLEGRLRYLKDKVSYSTLTVNFYERTETTTTYSFRFGEKFMDAIHGGWTGLLWFIIGLTGLWPFIIIIIVVILIIKRIRKNKKTKKGNNNFDFPPVK